MEGVVDQSANASQIVHSGEALLAFGENTVYLMGFSFMLGSLFTILMLILLDFMRRHSSNIEE